MLGSKLPGSLAGFLLLALLGLLAAAVALAHTQSTTAFVGAGSGWCMYGRAALNGEANQDAATVWSYADGCTAFKPKDPYRLRTRVKLLKRGSDGVYRACTSWDWSYNTTRTYATSTLETWGGPHGPCGSGRYKARGGQGLYHDGDWKYGVVTSPGHNW